MNQRLILLILIAFIATSAGAPTSGKEEESNQNVTPTPTKDDSTAKWWNYIRKNVLYPSLKLISADSTDDKHEFKSASAENYSNYPAPIEAPVEPPKIFAYLDDAVYEIANLTFMGYIYIGVLVIVIFLLICCTGCCCCCCGCCRCTR
uniref:Uncharacterized protein n=1 Tax=Panagrolaimus superbus TaxID=310955 RepID=A0A914YZZ1_9BILA